MFQGYEVRFVGTPEVPEWVATDVVIILYPNADKRNRRNYLTNIPSEWKGLTKVMTPGGMQSMVTLFEPGLYHLIARSKSPLAVPFEKWVFEEVLPSIRKSGSYSVSQSSPVEEKRASLEVVKLGM
ncbi:MULTISPECIES: Bro-N domain-containing protein, partial [unclassified Roseofilum]|uniref:BRO-N domain-containing protein n=1 Tax=unclassified Roseofilum TaxID=2620099 RepID=UPI00298D8C52